MECWWAWSESVNLESPPAESNHSKTNTMFEGTLARSASKAQNPTISWTGWRRQLWDFRCWDGKEASSTSTMLHPIAFPCVFFLFFFGVDEGIHIHHHTSGIGCAQAQAPKEAVAATMTCFLLFYRSNFTIVDIYCLAGCSLMLLACNCIILYL